jgi:hypothetical protein
LSSENHDVLVFDVGEIREIAMLAKVALGVELVAIGA